MSDKKPVVVTILPAQAALGGRIAEAIGARHDGRGEDFDSVTDHLVDVFRGGHPMVVVAAAGIVIRALSPYLGNKRNEPPVLVMSADGSSVVPLLGGHRGANRLAEKIAQTMGAHAAVTTAGDVVFGVALDEPPSGWVLDNPLDAKSVMSAVLGGAVAEITGNADWLAPLVDAGATQTKGGHANTVVVSVPGAAALVYRKQMLAIGVGCARGCDADHMISFVMKSLADAGISAGNIGAVHSIDLKSDEAAIHALARHLKVPALFHGADILEEQTSRLENPSDVVFSEVGCHGVSEGAALAAAGPDGDLILPKVKSETATLAVARIGKENIGHQGVGRGSLAVVGIGPGDLGWRSGEAARLVADADELVGYSLYLDLLGPAARGKVRRDFDLGEEEARCRYALEAAGEGRRVALICSGDGGIFAMGALVMELLHRGDGKGGVSPAARRVDITHAPGISALQAASARCGAILGHDFCAISLSDLLTPREAILKRLKAASEGDFVTAFYNPVSRRRRELLAVARDMYLQHRPKDCPVILASSLGRPEENLRIIKLQDLNVDDVDMLTIVLIGSSESKVIKSGDHEAGANGSWVFTPRGYAKKLETSS